MVVFGKAADIRPMETAPESQSTVTDFAGDVDLDRLDSSKGSSVPQTVRAVLMRDVRYLGFRMREAETRGLTPVVRPSARVPRGGQTRTDRASPPTGNYSRCACARAPSKLGRPQDWDQGGLTGRRPESRRGHSRHCSICVSPPKRS